MQAPHANDAPTVESLEGDAAHWVAYNLAVLYECGDAALAPVKGDKAPNGVEITQDMLDGAELWAETIGTGCTLETRVAVPSVHAHCFGTPDAWRHDPKVLRVYDYKFGHRVVDVFENWQLIAYAAGLISALPLSQHDVEFVEFVIVQPRSYCAEGPVRRWSCKLSHLAGLINQMHFQAGRAVDESGTPRADAEAKTGSECGDCKARATCTLFQSVAARIVDTSGRADRFDLSDAQLGAELSYLDECLDRLKARRDGLAIQAEVRLTDGRRVPGYGMESAPGNLKWLDNMTAAEGAILGETLGVQLLRDPELITPTQAKTAIKRKALDVELLDAYSFRPRGKMKLTQSTTDKARRAFGAK
jgi:hypothetical protein